MAGEHNSGVKAASDRPRSSATGVRVARNSGFGFIARMAEAVVRFVSIAMIAQYIGAKSFGDFAFITAISAFVTVFADFGIGPIMVREMSRHVSERRSILESVIVLRIAFSLLFLGGIVLSIRTTDYFAGLGLAMFIETMAQVFVAFQMMFLDVFRTVERVEYDMATSLGHQLLALALISAVVIMELAFVWLFVARAVAELTKMLVFIPIVHRKFIRVRLGVDLRRSMFLLKEALPVVLLSFLTVSSMRFHVFVLKYFRDPAEISFFDIPHRISMAINMMPLMAVMAVFPVLCRKAGSGGSSFSYAYEKSFKFLLLIALPVSVLLTVRAREIVTTFFGFEYLSCFRVLQIIGITLCTGFLIPLMNFVLTSVGKQAQTLWGVCVGLAVGFAFDLALVPRLGHLGAALGMVLGNVSYLAVNLRLVSKHACRIPIMSISLRPVLGAVVMFLVCLWSGRAGPLRMAVGSGIGCLCYVAVLVVLKTFSRNEIRTFVEMVKRRRPV